MILPKRQGATFHASCDHFNSEAASLIFRLEMWEML